MTRGAGEDPTKKTDHKVVCRRENEQSETEPDTRDSVLRGREGGPSCPVNDSLIWRGLRTTAGSGGQVEHTPAGTPSVHPTRPPRTPLQPSYHRRGPDRVLREGRGPKKGILNNSEQILPGRVRTPKARIKYREGLPGPRSRR